MPLVKVMDRKRIPFINHSGPTPHPVNLTATQIATLKNLGYDVRELDQIPARKNPIATPVQAPVVEPEPVVEEAPVIEEPVAEVEAPVEEETPAEEEVVEEVATEEEVVEEVTEEEEVPAEEATQTANRGGRKGRK